MTYVASATATRRGSRDDDRLKDALFDRLQSFLPKNAISARKSFEDCSLLDLNKKVAEFEQLAAKEIIENYRKQPFVHRERQEILAESLIQLAELAGEPIRRHHAASNASFGSTKNAQTIAKADARIAARNILFAGLRDLNSQYRGTDLFNMGLPILTDRDESQYPDDRLPRAMRWWLVQPLADFDREDVSTSIALINNGKPVLGAVHFPIRDFSFGGIPETRWTHARVTKKAVRSIEVRTIPERTRVAGTGYNKRKHSNFRSFIHAHDVDYRRGFESGMAEGFCRIARGSADLYIQDESVSEARVAASHAVLIAAGGSITSIQGETIRYQRGLANINPFVAAADARKLNLRSLRQVI
jgi:3'(2'), 5'-bisphosphate nucleotidase